MGMKPRLNDQFGTVRNASAPPPKKVDEFANIPGTVSTLKTQKIDPDTKIPNTETPSPKK